MGPCGSERLGNFQCRRIGSGFVGSFGGGPGGLERSGLRLSERRGDIRVTHVAFVALVGMRVSPTVIEYFTIQRVVNKIAKEGGTTVVEIRSAFDRAKSVEYGITSVSSADLDVTKDNDKVVISFAYDKEVELFDPVYLLIKYRGRSN